MNSILFQNFIFQFPPQNSIAYPHQFQFFPLKTNNYFTFPHKKKWISIPNTKIYSTNSDSASYGGWEIESGRHGESTQLRSFLISLGINDRKYVFVFIVGIVCALAVTKIRVSTIVMFPVSVAVFAVGFSIGFVRRGSDGGEISVNSGKEMSGKEDNFKVGFKKLRSLLVLFDDFDAKLGNLKNCLKSDVYDDHISVGDLKNYVRVIDSISESAALGKIVVEDCIETVGESRSDGVLVETQNLGRRKKEISESGFIFTQFMGGFFKDNFIGMERNKLKANNIQRNVREIRMNRRTEGNVLEPPFEQFLEFVNDDNKPVLSQDKVKKLGDATRTINIAPGNTKMDMLEIDRSAEKLYRNEQYSYQNQRFGTVNDQYFSLNEARRSATETWEAYDSSLDPANFNYSIKRTESEAFFHGEQILRKSNESYLPSQSREKIKAHGSNIREEQEYMEDLADNNQFIHEGENDNSSSSLLSDDVLFDRYLGEANDLLKQARSLLRSGGSEDRAEGTLYDSAELLSKAIAMKPMSLLATGQLGNTYLLHGELKLKISRQLRTLLMESNPLSFEKKANVLKGLGVYGSNKSEIRSHLVNVCEECEGLLVEAGKKYRMALSIDGDDTRALYNWGLALSFRAQLIADIGPKAAFDADKVFLAAIDKFDAMMSKGNIYTPEALFRWGVALQQRSRLRPRKSKEKLKLLQQAKQLYEDALHIDSGNLQVREALSSCISELNLRPA